MRLPLGVRGTGPRTLLLLHGFTGSRRSWDGAWRRISTGRRGLFVDLPGHAQAPLPRARGQRGFAEVLSALEAVVLEHGRPPVDVVGYSQGARLALALAIHRPELVRRVVLEGVHPGLRRAKQRAARRRQERRWAQVLRTEGVDAFIRWWERRPLLAGLSRAPAAVRTALAARRRSHSPEGLRGALACMGLGAQPDLWPALPRLRRPVLLLTGAEDLKFARLAQQMAARLPRARHLVLEGCGHAPHLEAPARWASEVERFLRGPKMTRSTEGNPGGHAPASRRRT